MNARTEGIADRVAESKLLVVSARIASVMVLSLGVPAIIWLFTVTISHGNSITVLHGDDRDHKRRIERLEAIADRLPEDDRRLRDRIAAIETAAARVETQAQALLQALNEMRRERVTTPPYPPPAR